MPLHTKVNRFLCIVSMVLAFGGALSKLLSTQPNALKLKHQQYKLVEVGTFGGPNIVYNVFTRIARNDGTVVGAANTCLPLLQPIHAYCAGTKVDADPLTDLK